MRTRVNPRRGYDSDGSVAFTRGDKLNQLPISKQADGCRKEVQRLGGGSELSLLLRESNRC